jgi:uncharacterized protein (DUF58 family)
MPANYPATTSPTPAGIVPPPKTQPDPIFSSRVSQLELKARHIVEGYLTGLHRSPYFGQSVEFVQHREYVAGDDPRRIDWKMWSKTDKFYIKQYEEDTNLRTTLVVDASESMQFGSGATTKFEYGCTIAASLAYLLLKQQDAVGLTLFDETIRAQLPPRTQRSQLHALLSMLDVQKAAQKSDLYGVLRKIADAQSQKGIIVLISDLFTPRESLFKGLKLLRHRGHEVLVFHILDDEELDFNYSGTTKFEGLESAGDLLCDPRSLREGYIAAMTAFLDDLRTECAKQVIDFQTIRTSESVDAVLRHYINHRLGMRTSARS